MHWGHQVALCTNMICADNNENVKGQCELPKFYFFGSLCSSYHSGHRASIKNVILVKVTSWRNVGVYTTLFPCWNNNEADWNRRKELKRLKKSMANIFSIIIVEVIIYLGKSFLQIPVFWISSDMFCFDCFFYSFWFCTWNVLRLFAERSHILQTVREQSIRHCGKH